MTGMLRAMEAINAVAPFLIVGLLIFAAAMALLSLRGSSS